MASVFKNKGSDWIYISYVGKDGVRHKSNTGYKWSNLGQRRQAQRLADAKTLEEHTQARQNSSGRFESWVSTWILTRYGNSRKSLIAYQARWRNVEKYLTEIKVEHPMQLTRENVMAYVGWREDHNGARNTALRELGMLSMVMAEAILRKYCQHNPATALKLRNDRPKEKPAWTDEEITKVDDALRADQFGWMRCTFLLGRYQALRIAQCSVPLEGIDLERGMIHYPDWTVKGGKGFSQPISPKFMEELKAIVEHRRAEGYRTLCDVPALCSLEWRKFLDGLNLPHLSHHGLRVSWISKAAMRGIPAPVAMKFANHSSRMVHQIYQRAEMGDVACFLKNL